MVLCLTSVLAVSCATPGGRTKCPEGFVPLFNGEDLTGWSGDSKLWSVRDGVIVGSTEGVPPIEANTFLSTEKAYGDFILLIKVKLRNHNSGIQFRSTQKPDHVVTGYQADVAEQKYFGMLYREKAGGFMPYWKALPQEERTAIHAAAKQGDWNAFEITCQGDRIKMVLNGKTTCDITHPEGEKEGVIGLQLHRGDPMEVYFKDIVIKEL